MHTYQKVKGDDLWVVGYWLRDGKGHSWHALSDHSSVEAACKQVNYLNGGNAHVTCYNVEE